MNRTWLIARHHFLIEVRKRTFLLILFSLPGFIGLTVGMGILIDAIRDKTPSIGVIDPDDFLQGAVTDRPDDLELRYYATKEEAETALLAEELDAYYLLEPGFAADRHAQLVYTGEPPDGAAQSAVRELIRRRFLQGEPVDLTRRALEGAQVVVTVSGRDREFGSNPTLADFLPLLVGLMLGFMAMTSSGYMMEVIVAEKENRTIEILATSVSTRQLMGGKTLGAVGIALLQLLVWTAFLVGGIWLGRAAGVGWLEEMQPRWKDIAQTVVVGLPAYFFLTACFTTIGSMLNDSNDSQQIGPSVLILLMAPVYVLGPIGDNPDGPLAMLFFLLPPTAITTTGLRLLITSLPWWQIALSALVSLASGVGMTWLAARAFRMGMLRYGQRMRLRELLGGARRPRALPGIGGGHE